MIINPNVDLYEFSLIVKASDLVHPYKDFRDRIDVTVAHRINRHVD